MSAVLRPLRVPAVALLVGLGGVGLALLYFHDKSALALAVVAALIVLGVIIDAAGRAALPDHPKAALHLLEGWVLIPIALAVLASAAVVVLTVELTLPDSGPSKPTTETKELVSAVSTGITAFLTAGFIAWTEDDKDSSLADHVKASFQDKYTRSGTPKKGAHVFRAESAGERWVFSENYAGADGWGGKARAMRATGIAHELETGGSDPPS
jgi:hypothetical protein